MEKKRLDDLFNYALVLLAIISAAEFQYFLATEKRELWFYILKIHTYPHFVLISFWLMKELLKDIMGFYFDMILTEFLWEFWSFTLFFYLLTIIGIEPLQKYLSLSFALLLIFAITWAYHRASQTSVRLSALMHKYNNDLIWRISRFLLFIGSYIFLVLIVFPR